MAVCPLCPLRSASALNGQRRVMMRRLGLVAAVTVLVGGSLLSACSGTTDAAGGDGKPSAGSSTAMAEKSAPPAQVKIVKAGWEDHPVWGPHAYIVHWELTNTGVKVGSFYAGLQFLDKDGDVLGSTGVTADKVGPGKTAKGDASPLAVEITNGAMSGIRSARVSEVTRME